MLKKRIIKYDTNYAKKTSRGGWFTQSTSTAYFINLGTGYDTIYYLYATPFTFNCYNNIEKKKCVK